VCVCGQTGITHTDSHLCGITKQRPDFQEREREETEPRIHAMRLKSITNL